MKQTSMRVQTFALKISSMFEHADEVEQEAEVQEYGNLEPTQGEAAPQVPPPSVQTHQRWSDHAELEVEGSTIAQLAQSRRVRRLC